MKIALQKAPRLHKGIPWTACEPFVENTRICYEDNRWLRR